MLINYFDFRADLFINLTTKLAKIVAMESSQPSYLGNPNLHRQAVWLCFYNQKGFQDFRVTNIFDKTRDQNIKKNRKLKWCQWLTITKVQKSMHRFFFQIWVTVRFMTS